MSKSFTDEHRSGSALSFSLTALRLLGGVWGVDRFPVGSYIERSSFPLLEKLSEAERGIEMETVKTDREFISFGQDLRSLYSASQDIVEKGKRLFTLATGKEQIEDAISETLNLLVPALDYVATIAAASAEATDFAVKTRSSAQEILELETALERELAPLTYIRALFEIESARLEPGVRQMFGGLNSEIETLRRHVAEQFGAKFAELRETTGSLESLERQRSDRSAAMSLAAELDRKVLADSLARLRASVASNSSRHEGLWRLVQDLGADLDAMVVAMQAHDIVTQRVAHVRRGLQMVHADVSALHSANLRECRQQLPTLAAMAKLQAGQVRSARLQMAEAVGSLHASVARVAEKISALDEDCLILKGFENLTSAANGSVQILLDGIESAERMVKNASASARACYEPLQPLSALAANLASEIDNTGEKMCRIALNTQIIAVQQGAGTGLEVLAGKMAGTAGEISRICGLAEQGLEGLTASLGGTIRQHQQIAETGDALKATFEGPGAERSHALHGFRDLTLQMMFELGRAADLAHHLIGGMQQAKLDRLCGILEPIEEAVSALAEWAGRLSMGLNGAAIEREQFDLMKAQYTMHSERQVHQEYLEGGAPSALANQVDADGVAIPEYAGGPPPANTISMDNVELF